MIGKLIRPLLLIFLINFLVPAVSAISLKSGDDLYGTEWYGIYMGRNKIGYSKGTFESTGSNKWITTTAMTLSFKVNQATATVNETDKRTYEGKDGEMSSIEFTYNNPTGDVTVKGKIRGNSFALTTIIAGQSTTQNLPRPVETLDDAMRLSFWVKLSDIKIGDTLRYSCFLADPPIAAKLSHIAVLQSRETMLFAGIPTAVFTVHDSIPDMSVGGDIILTEQGRIIEQRIAGMAIITRAEPEEVAKQIDEEFDLLSNNLIQTDSGPVSAQAVKKATYLITGFDISLLPKADNVSIEQFKSDSAQLTIISDTTIPATSEIADAQKQYLAPEQLIQSADPDIIKLAKEITQGGSDQEQKAKLINHWVYTNIAKEYSPELSNALATLRSRKGDCGEHSALAVALLRASGIPARIASGVVYWPEGKGFAYHAWVELYLGKWIQMDPTWDETTTNATHIMLTNEGVEKQIGAIVNAMRGMKIKFISYE
jgi:hypothetical protein